MSGNGQPPLVISTVPGGDADLLGGLRGTNASNQKSKVLDLKRRQEAGQEQGGAGMGGGVF